ncbi:MAG: hypothetical protein Q4F41_11860 [Eubacteriales bacterium]|nr:hypothetical protein [Eubacteriales bacterium]
MKKIGLALGGILLAVAMGNNVKAAENLEVQIIGGEAESSEVKGGTLEDVQLEEEIEIEGYASFTATEFETVDEMECYRENTWNYQGYPSDTMSSGVSADYMILYVSLINKKKSAVDFIADISEIVVTYDEEYKYAGWLYQCDPNMPEPKYGIHSNNQFEIEPLYEGTYKIGCTLPNAVVNGKEQLVLTFKLKDNEVTYYIRK